MFFKNANNLSSVPLATDSQDGNHGNNLTKLDRFFKFCPHFEEKLVETDCTWFAVVLHLKKNT